MRPAKPIVPAPDDGEDEGPGRTFVKGRYTTTRYQRRSANLPRLSGAQRTGPPPPQNPAVGSPWTKYEARSGGHEVGPVEDAGVPAEAIVVDLRDDETSEPPKPADRSTWYQRHSARLPRLTEAGDDDA